MARDRLRWSFDEDLALLCPDPARVDGHATAAPGVSQLGGLGLRNTGEQ
jgi:hypothetical protein